MAQLMLTGNSIFAKDSADEPTHSDAQVELGRFLFFDKILSGNQNISCASCHHPLVGTGDGLSLSIGEGGRGLGMTRDTGSGDDAVVERVPRNSPALFNLGKPEFERLFHDGRVAVNPEHPSGFDSAAGMLLPNGLENVLAAQAMFPVTSPGEMAGQIHEGVAENDIAAAANAVPADIVSVWALLAERLKAIQEYIDLFQSAYPNNNIGNDGTGITFVLAANAIAAYEAHSWRADNSPFDRYLHGDDDAMSDSAKKVPHFLS
ncbi:MAG TPA: hypothetical protein DCZ03_03005, partial [Gammaproteobacteria bacterium]|nr:hypothetical protein [Gammaproteobacteria bacterium]